ncbi:flagellar protein FlgN [Nocardioides nematodiphilus]|uniref:flagellar protein FlgN n=1 Tax=Nocardioides nematodiphilus TaxID=2849669 RepID=UPI001CDA33CF|nr:flagellar protein FlgN [Nocardioides nematodiphilus]MCA1983195.1 flagellar protein FlgN [Nocardioides nematodiphilus]
MEKLSLILWRERELLETLAYKLEVEQLILASGRSRWLAHSTKEVEEVLELLRETEVLRAIAADEVAEDLGLAPAPTLSAIAEAAAEPWRAILDDHRTAFVTATREIAELSESNRGLITAGYRSARETLLSLGGNADGYSPDGSAVLDAPRKRLLDRSL